MIECKERDPQRDIWTPEFKELGPGELFKRKNYLGIFLKTDTNCYMSLHSGSLFYNCISPKEIVTAYSGQLTYWAKRI